MTASHPPSHARAVCWLIGTDDQRPAAVWLVGGSSYGTDDVPSSAYAQPLEALHGDSLATYVAAHEAARLAR